MPGVDLSTNIVVLCSVLFDIIFRMHSDTWYAFVEKTSTAALSPLFFLQKVSCLVVINSRVQPLYSQEYD